MALLPLWLFALSGCAPEPPRELVLLGQPGPWPWVSDLGGYGERLWLANSVKHREHNPADLYSFDPRSSSFRYEPPQALFTERLRANFAAGDVDLLNGRGPRVPLGKLGPWALFSLCSEHRPHGPSGGLLLSLGAEAL